jgi:tetratricopeptide (TPR) repeat protein
MPRREHVWSRWRTLLGLGVLLLQVTAAAREQAPVQALLQEARRRFDNLEYERALVELLSAQRLTRIQDELVSIHLLKGIVLAELGKKAEASEAFREALRLRPGAVLPLEVSPKISRQFEAVSEALAVTKLEPEKRSTESGPQAEPRPTPPGPPQKAPALVAPSAPPPANAAQAEKAAVQGQSQAQPPAALPQINVVVTPNQEVNIVPPAYPVMPLSPMTTPAGAVEAHRSRPLSPHILIPAGAGGALAITGGIFWGLARKEFSKIESDDPRLDSLTAVQGSASNGRTYQTVGLSLMGAGLVSLGLAAGLYGMDKTDSPMELSVGVNGTQAVLHGRWW